MKGGARRKKSIRPARRNACPSNVEGAPSGALLADLWTESGDVQLAFLSLLRGRRGGLIAHDRRQRAKSQWRIDPGQSRLRLTPLR